jgi:hypothetical protein
VSRFNGLRGTEDEDGALGVGERSEAVVLHLEEPLRMVERLRKPQERHGPEWQSSLEAGA